MKRTGLLLMLLMATVAGAMGLGVCDDGPDWSLWGLAGPDGADLRIGYIPVTGVEIGAVVGWLDGDCDPRTLMGYLLWHVAPDVNIPVAGLFPWVPDIGIPKSLPGTIYLGGQIGGDFETKDSIASLLVGIMIQANTQIGLGLEYQYAFDEDQWSELGQLVDDDRHTVAFVLNGRF